MATIPVTLNGITQEDIQRIIAETLRRHNKPFNMLGFDSSYLYNFHVSDFEYIRRLNLLTRYIPEKSIEWHRMLERWYSDQTVVDNFNRPIKPVQLIRQFDRVVNEGLENFARGVVGHSVRIFKVHGIGNAVGITEALPNDFGLVDQVNRVDVTEAKEGGSLSRDGSTIYIVGNHPASIASTTITETAVFDKKEAVNDRCLDHSVFYPTGIVHDQDEDIIGSTTIIYMCGI